MYTKKKTHNTIFVRAHTAVWGNESAPEPRDFELAQGHAARRQGIATGVAMLLIGDQGSAV